MESFALMYSLTMFVIYLVAAIIYIVSFWRIFTKAGVAGWKCLIPIYNLYVMLSFLRKPAWWLIMFLLPVAALPFYLIGFMSAIQGGSVGGGSVLGILVFFISAIISFVYSIKMYIALVKAFGYSPLFVLGILFLPIIFFPVIAFDGNRFCLDGDNCEVEE